MKPQSISKARSEAKQQYRDGLISHSEAVVQVRMAKVRIAEHNRRNDKTTRKENFG